MQRQAFWQIQLSYPSTAELQPECQGRSTTTKRLAGLNWRVRQGRLHLCNWQQHQPRPATNTGLNLEISLEANSTASDAAPARHNLALDPAALIDLQLTLYGAGKPYYQGYIQSAEYIGSAAGGSWHHYRCTVHEPLAQLAASCHTQVLRQQSSQQTVQWILDNAACYSTHRIKYTFELFNNGQQHPWLWQWQRSDLWLLQQLCQLENWFILPVFTPALRRRDNNIATDQLQYKIADHKYLIALTTSQNIQTLPYYPRCQQYALQHRPCITHLEIHYAAGTVAPHLPNKLLVACTMQAWQLGTLIKIKLPQHKASCGRQSSLENSAIEHATWVICKMNIPALLPTKEHTCYECQLELQSLEYLEQPKPVIWPRCAELLTAKVVSVISSSQLAKHRSEQQVHNLHAPATNKTGTSGSVAQVKPDECNTQASGYYSIAFAHEAPGEIKQQPYVPYLDMANSPSQTSPQTDPINSSKTPPPAGTTRATLTAGTSVLIKMLDGNFNYPVIIGCIQDQNHKSPITQKNSQQHIISTTQGDGMLLDDTEKNIKCGWFTQQQQQEIMLFQPPAKVGIKISNLQAGITQQANSIYYQATKCNLKADKKIKIHATGSIRITNEQQHITWQARYIEQQSGREIRLHSTDQCKLRSRSMQFKIREQLHIGAQHGTLNLQAKRIQIKHSSHCHWQTQQKITLQSAGQQITLNPQQIIINANSAKFTAGVIVVSGV